MRFPHLLLFYGIAVASLTADAGNRTLQTPARVLAGNTTSLTTIFAGDFTADGKPDVLLSETGTIRVLPGLGSGLFGAPVVTVCATFVPEGLADFNGDGRPDLYLIGDTGQIGVMFGAGNGSFAAPAAVPSAVPAQELVAGDFTGDGLIDLGRVSAGQVVILQGDGSGAFTTAHSSPPAGLPDIDDATSGDFDDDGKLDIALATESAGIVAWNNGTSLSYEDLPQSWDTSAAEATDLDGDGISDLILSGQAGTYVSFGNATRVLTAMAFPGTFEKESILAVGTLDGDARADVLIGGTSVKVLSHDGTAFRPLRSFGTGLATLGVAAADFDGDGKSDVVAIPSGSIGTPDHFLMMRGGGDGTLRADIAINLSEAMGDKGLERMALLSDVNGDEKLDIVALTRFANHIAVMFGHGDGTFDDAVFTTLPASLSFPSIHDAGDLNGDGRADVVLWDPGFSFVGDIEFRVLFADSNGTFSIGAVQTTPNGSGTATRLHAILDYTGDGNADLFAMSGTLIPGLGNGTFGPPIHTGIDTWADDTTIGDVNGDSLPDVIFDESLHLNEGEGVFAAALAIPAYGIQCLSDMNSDGFADIIAGGIFFGNGHGGFATNGVFGIDTRTRCATGDVDGDGRLDVMAGNAIFFGAAEGKFDAAAQTTNGFKAGAVVATEDIDGNGSPDLWLRTDEMITIVPTRRGDVGTAPSNLTVHTLPNPSSYPGPYQTQALIDASTAKPRGVVLFKHGSEEPRAMYCVSENADSVDFHASPAVNSTTSITATFLGDEHYGPSSASTNHTVQKGPTTVTVKTNKSSYQSGEPVIIFATLQGKLGGSPTGTITYKRGDTVIGVLPASAGQGLSFDSRDFPAGAHVISTEYSGDTNFQPSVSSPTKTITIIRSQPKGRRRAAGHL